MEIQCDCSIDGAGDDNEAYWSTVRTARKPHHCCECHEVIRPGEQYEDCRLVCHGKFSKYHTCWFCLELREKYCPNGWFFGDVAEQIEECLGFDYRLDPDLIDDE